MEFLWNMIYGAIIGVANIIPGVSGGTMAVILDIYDDLINAIGELRHHFKKSIKFLIPIGLGAGVGILLFSALIKYLLGQYPMPINFLFMGLIIGSIPMIYKRARVNEFKLGYSLSFLLPFLLMMVMAFLGGESVGNAVITTLTLDSFVKLFLYSAIAAACMILPGMSGSMVLMILGVYTTILTAIADFNILILMPVGLGVLVGILGGAKLIEILLKKYPNQTFLAILGLVVGSIFPVFNNSGFTFSGQGIVAIIALIIGAILTFIFSSEQFKEKISKKDK